MKTSWRSASLVASAVSVLALTTACGQEGGTAASSQNVGVTAPAGTVAGVGSGYGGVGAGTSPSASAPGAVGAGGAAQAGTAGQLAVSANDELGKVVIDAAGMTLYRFDADTAQPPKSNCDGDCATTWPPVPADDATAGDGIDKSLLGEVTRTDGTKQLTVDGWPVYTYIGDKQPGQWKGQNVSGKWFVIEPTGKKNLTCMPSISKPVAPPADDSGAGAEDSGSDYSY